MSRGERSRRGVRTKTGVRKSRITGDPAPWVGVRTARKVRSAGSALAPSTLPVEFFGDSSGGVLAAHW
jgi:hypothetical protein